eukprot:m.341931 g.341931  ORF g.341931 m.341931 type:complete len:382 (+) comp20679_c0_seq1:297-1442(+)
MMWFKMTLASVLFHLVLAGSEDTLPCVDQVQVPKTWTTVPNMALANCDNVSVVFLHEQVEEIGNSSFANCPKLRILFFGGQNLKVIGNHAFAGSNITEIVFPNSVEIMGDSAFAFSPSLKTVLLPSKLKVVPPRAFYGCSALQHVHINLPANSLLSVGEAAFEGCTSLEFVDLPSTLQTVSDLAFNGTSKLRNITFPRSLTYIGECAFGFTTQLTSAIFSNSHQTSPHLTIGRIAFYDSGIKTLNIPSYIDAIDSNAFSHCLNLESVVIEERKETLEIAVGAFLGDTNLRSVTIPKNVKIGDAAFKNTSCVDESIFKPGNKVVNCKVLNIKKHENGMVTVESAILATVGLLMICAVFYILLSSRCKRKRVPHYSVQHNDED